MEEIFQIIGSDDYAIGIFGSNESSELSRGTRILGTVCIYLS